MTLETQTFLRGGGTVDDLADRYAIKANTCAELGVIALNYSQVLSPMNEPICQECRGLILEVGTWNVVSRSFFKFFNHGQPEAAAIDWATARIEEKLDGSLISLYHWRDEWRIATRGVADASGMVGANGLSFHELVHCAIGSMRATWRTLTGILSPNYCYSFELTCPENRVIVPYWERRLTLLAAWRLRDLQEVDVRDTGIGRSGICPVVQRHNFTVYNFDDLAKLAEKIDPADGEGFVVVDATFNRVKVKSPLYVASSTLVAGLTTTKQFLELLRSDKYDDVRPLLPDFIVDQADTVRANLLRMSADILRVYDEIAAIEVQKDFAAEAMKHSSSAVLFALRKGQTIQECFTRMTIDSLCRLYDDLTAT